MSSPATRRFSLSSRNSHSRSSSSSELAPFSSTSNAISPILEQGATTFLHRMNRRSKLAFGVATEELDFGCAGNALIEDEVYSGRRASSSTHYASNTNVLYGQQDGQRRSSASSSASSSTSSYPPSLSHSRATSASSSGSFSDGSSSQFASPQASPTRYNFPTVSQRSPVSPTRSNRSLLSEQKRKSEELAAIEAMNDYFCKVKLDPVEEHVTVHLGTNLFEENDDVEVSFLTGLSTTFSPTHVDFSHDNSHNSLYAVSSRSPASSPTSHTSDVSTLRASHYSFNNQNSPVSPILDVDSELDSLSDYFASPVQSSRNSPTPSLTSLPVLALPAARKSIPRARPYSTSASYMAPLGASLNGGKNGPPRSLSASVLVPGGRAYGWI